MGLPEEEGDAYKVIPANAGIQASKVFWTPAFAGVTP